MSLEEPVDLVIIGGGGAGVFAALRAANLGLRTVIVEDRKFGGVCLHWGGLATKTLTSIVELFKNASKATDSGIQGSLSLDWEKMQAYKKDVCTQMSRIPLPYLKRQGVRVIIGKGEIKSPTEVQITSEDGDETIHTSNILIATGSHTISIPGVELTPPILDSDLITDLKSLPRQLLIIGGGIVGLEFATIFNLLGSEVIIVEMLPTLLPSEEPDVQKYLQRNLTKEGMEVLVNSKVTGVNPGDNEIKVTIETTSGEITKTVDNVLMAIGRRPNIDLENLEALGVQATRWGITVNEHMQTSVPSIWAAGDAVEPHLLANVAIREGEVAVTNMASFPATMDYSLVPRCVFTIPEIAAVGLTEQQATDQQIDVQVAKVPFSFQNFRAYASNKKEGFIKVLAKKDGTIIGATIVGASASDLISQFIVAIRAKMTAKEMSELIFVHPSFSETIKRALERLQMKLASQTSG